MDLTYGLCVDNQSVAYKGISDLTPKRVYLYGMGCKFVWKILTNKFGGIPLTWCKFWGTFIHLQVLKENTMDPNNIDLSPVESTLRHKLMPFQEDGVR